MKIAITILLFLTVSLTAIAQSPEKMSYQAIIRKADNTLVINGPISLRVIVRQGASTGTAVYQETHNVNTNNNGLVSLEIGTGASTGNAFSAIAWQTGPYFIETQVDCTGGSNYNIISITQLLSVPYALHAKTADRIVGSSTTNPYRSVVIPFITSRNIATTDINNTVECTKSATLTLTSNFANMLVGDTINLEAHNGAILSIQAASDVQLNYKLNGSASFTSATGNVSFGFLRKINTNTYIISGQ
ncbi:hypothetical protein [Flavobacterium algicola]|uniref:hypothetical protein n=1 Tax=Flavobacterium algicola TaxID=556529 RepID=UPI001EFD42C0|nr:hypothetical protein [Flavobacterium algicola]MCG9793505.1 hypothetical protein [Flavobacterium algicola]